MEPRCHQMASKIDFQINQKKQSHFGSLLKQILLDLGSQPGPQEWVQEQTFGGVSDP